MLEWEEEVSMSDQPLKHIKGVFMDWAGTTVDYGCFSPLDVFLEIFRKRGIEITQEEAREPMGLLKWDHIQTLCQVDRIAGLWKDKFGKYPEKQDVDDLYADFEPSLMSILPDYNQLIPGAADVANRLQRMNIKIGTTTGFTRDMIDIVVPDANEQGYHPDSVVTSDEMPAGRPKPWMIFQNAMNLDLYPLSHCVKIGDTISDIKEGRNAGVWTVGVIKGGSLLGMSKEDVNNSDADTLDKEMERARKRFKAEGADYVVNSIDRIFDILPKIDLRISQSQITKVS